MSVTVKGLAIRVFGGGSKVDLAALKKWNIAVAILLAVQAVAILLFSGIYMLPVYLSYLTRDSLLTKLHGTTVVAPALHELTQVNLAYLGAGMLLVTALIYLLLATLLRRRYEAWLKNSWQPMRWAIVAAMGSCVLITIALLAGMRQLDSLRPLVILMIIAGLAALQLELQPTVGRSAPMSAWIGVTISLLAAFVPWLLIGLVLVTTNIFGDVGVPAYTWWLFGTMLAGWTSFVVVAHLYHIRYGQWASYTYVECWTTGLILLIETTFIWQLFAAVLRP